MPDPDNPLLNRPATGNPLLSDPVTAPARTMADILRAGPPPEPQEPVPDGPEISSRVPVPPDHFPEDEHDGLHEMMGKTFENPAARHFVRVAYQVAKARHPDVPSRHLLEAARDGYHAVQYGFAPVAHALDYAGAYGRLRHQEAERRKTS